MKCADNTHTRSLSVIRKERKEAIRDAANGVQEAIHRASKLSEELERVMQPCFVRSGEIRNV